MDTLAFLRDSCLSIADLVVAISLKIAIACAGFGSRCVRYILVVMSILFVIQMANSLCHNETSLSILSKLNSKVVLHRNLITPKIHAQCRSDQFSIM
jgi:hypothetical protein